MERARSEARQYRLASKPPCPRSLERLRGYLRSTAAAAWDPPGRPMSLALGGPRPMTGDASAPEPVRPRMTARPAPSPTTGVPNPMTTLARELRGSYAFIERNLFLVKRYWGWEFAFARLRDRRAPCPSRSSARSRATRPCC